MNLTKKLTSAALPSITYLRWPNQSFQIFRWCCFIWFSNLYYPVPRYKSQEKSPELFLTDVIRDSFLFHQYNSLLILNYRYVTTYPLPSLFLYLLRFVFALCLYASAACQSNDNHTHQPASGVPARLDFSNSTLLQIYTKLQGIITNIAMLNKTIIPFVIL